VRICWDDERRAILSACLCAHLLRLSKRVLLDADGVLPDDCMSGICRRSDRKALHSVRYLIPLEVVCAHWSAETRPGTGRMICRPRVIRPEPMPGPPTRFRLCLNAVRQIRCKRAAKTS
jgi:hypothetical protein